MKRLKFLSIRELLYNKKFAVTFSIVLAFAIWLSISLYQNPEREQTFSDIPITINTKGTVVEELGMDLINDLSETDVAVTVYGPNYIVSSLSNEDVIVSVSLSDVTEPGTYVLQLNATKSNKNLDYNFVNVSPSSITAKFDYIDTQEFDVVPQAEGASAVSNLIAEAPVLSDLENAKLTVKGPRTEMKKINKVVAVAAVNKQLSATTSFDADVRLLDSDGKEIDKSIFTLETNTVKISVPISKKATFKIEPTFLNMPSEKVKDYVKISYDISNITVIGPPNAIDAMTSVQLSPIDFTKVSKSNGKFELTPVLPDGVKTLDNVAKVVATVRTSDLAERTVTVSNVEFINKPGEITKTSASNVKNVKICGPSRVINSLKASNLKAIVDLKGKSVGEHTVNVTIHYDQNPVIWQVGQCTTSIELK